MSESQSSQEILNQSLQNLDKSALEKAIALAVAMGLIATIVPKGNEIDTTSKLNPKTPVYFSGIERYEDRMNEHLGICQATGRSLVEPMHFISDMIQQYMRITPSTGKSEKNRAELFLETMQKGALLPSESYGVNIPQPRALEPPQPRSLKDKLTGKNKNDSGN